MDKVKIKGDMAEYDELDGITLEDGEKVLVLWPDSSLEHMVVNVETHYRKEGGHGKPAERAVSEAYVTVNYKGLPIQVRLRNGALKVERR